ncbi:hypothetical protein LTR10_016160 [Elasticomyces elasticus]|uniref:Oxidoreductase acuF-like C2H2 type zinc-finger domain-containing protein n=1 Tax=Exophiala sideris TaxID=1016849 RepID=A0ABR0JET0_9EURO|nr:hypothetical protein LTR10_016160 [Elasticomyces elasticus]KAK5027606.1 hypothetical protein LTR13_009539 [Exophiala sideris]KAK5032831.1 hypothetical protein LTS07_004241 [Exophiala sideris]KAK5062355.1 hypothetical protein LTR69_004713 [Exophiala sideris]KAK5177513.1 hypothetical protein LTR44_009923 [Eurotiomycetes sp. CCFEE 6388]
MVISISSELIDCLRLFNALISRDDLASHATEVPTRLWTGELGRLRLWAANIGAHQSGESSVDHRLREASHIRGQTVKLLERLRQVLQDLEELLEGVDQDLEDLLDGLDQEDGELQPQRDDETDAQQIYSSLVTTVDCLFQMSMIIRRPTYHDRLLGSKRIDATTFEPFDKQHVISKYPQAHHTVTDRLGAAISRRRAALKYRQRHREKLGEGIESIDQPDAISTRLSETIATDFEDPPVNFEGTGSDSGLSQTSYASSLWESGEKITVPRPPKESSGGNPFECPYCFFIVTVSDRREWIRHVFRDLMPYICVFPDCPASNRLYETRREWFQHLQAIHLSGPIPSESIDCQLHCGVRLPITSLERHLGRHLEELALFALPKAEEGDEEDFDQAHSSTAEAKFEDDISTSEGDEDDLALPETSGVKNLLKPGATIDEMERNTNSMGADEDLLGNDAKGAEKAEKESRGGGV